MRINISYKLIFLGFLFLFSNQLKTQNLDSLKDIVNSDGKLNDKLNTLQDIVQIYAFENYDSAMKYAYQNIEFSKLSPDSLFLLSAYNYIGNINLLHSNYDSSIKYFKMANNLAEKINNKKFIAQNYGNLATTYALLSDYEKASKYQKKEIEAFESVKDTMGLLIALSNLAINQFRTRDFEEELETAKRFFITANNFTDLSFYLESKGSLAWAYASNDSLEKSKIMFEDVFNETDKYEIDSTKLILFWARYSSLLVELNQINEAKQFANKYLKDLDIQGNADFYRNKAFSEIYLYENNYEKALIHAKASLERAKIEKEEFLIKDSYDLLQKVYFSLEKYDSAYSYLNSYKQISDSLFNSEKLKAVKKIEAQYKLESRKKEIENLKAKAQAKEKLIFWQTLGIALFFIILIILMIRYYSNKKKAKILLQNKTKILEQELELNKQKHKLEIKAKENEIRAKAIKLSENYSVIEQLKEKLDDYEENVAKSKTLNQILDELSLQNNPDLSLKEFEFKFREIYPLFFTKLSEKYTELTKTELRICAFLKMNLTSKEVAAIINTSPLTINSHRYSIRKKLGLDSKDSIFEFLQQL